MISFFQDNKELLAENISEEKTLSIYKLIMDGGLGGQIIIALLFVLLAVALYIYFERFFAIKSASKIDENFMNQIKEFVSKGKLESADALCKSKNTPTARWRVICANLYQLFRKLGTHARCGAIIFNRVPGDTETVFGNRNIQRRKHLVARLQICCQAQSGNHIPAPAVRL